MLNFLPIKVCDQLDNLKYGLVDCVNDLPDKARKAREGTVQDYCIWGRETPSAHLNIQLNFLPPDKGPNQDSDTVALCSYVWWQDTNHRFHAHCVDLPYQELFPTQKLESDITTYLVETTKYLCSERFLEELKTWNIKECEA